MSTVPVSKEKLFNISPCDEISILLVDDEPAIVEMIKMMLERIGYRVEAMINPVEALKLFRSKPDDFDLVMTDMNMPHFNGGQLAAEIKKIRRDISVILCTGFIEKINREKACTGCIDAFLLKPVSMSSLSERIREVLKR